MDTLSAIDARRAVKHYDPEHRFTEAEEAQLFAALRRSPTSFNIQNARFVVVRDPSLRKQLRAAAWDQAQVTDASLLFVICGDHNAYAKDPARYWRTAPQEVREFLVGAIGQFYGGNETLQRDEVLRSAGIAAQSLMLAAKAMGYDSCPMVGYDPKTVAEIIRLPEDHSLALMVAVGKAVEPARERGGDIPQEESIIIDHF